jgi:hypothetical protein
VIERLAPNRANQPLDEGMGERDIRDGLGFCDSQDPQVGLPLMELIQRVMIRAEILRQTASSAVSSMVRRCAGCSNERLAGGHEKVHKEN